MFDISGYDIITRQIDFEGETLWESRVVGIPELADLADFADTEEEARFLMEESIETVSMYYDPAA